MRLCNVMNPARNYEEAAMRSADTRTVTGGAALKMVQCMQPEAGIRTIEIAAVQTQQKAACCATACKQAAAYQSRAALYNLLRHSF